jgi:hypothetical protein
MENNNMAVARARAEQAGTAGIPLRALVFAGVIFAFSLMVYAGLQFGYKVYLNNAIANLDTQIAALDNLAPADERERDFISFYSLATNTQRLLTNHVSISSVFDFFERNTLADVAIETMKIAVQEKEISFSGAAKGYEQLARQLAIYENAPEVTEIGISGSRFGNNVVQFEAVSNMKAEIFSSLASIKAETQTETSNVIIPITTTPITTNPQP